MGVMRQNINYGKCNTKDIFFYVTDELTTAHSGTSLTLIMTMMRIRTWFKLTCPKLKFHLYYRWQQAKQVTLSEKWCSSWIGLGSILFNIYTYDLLSIISKKFA